MLKSGTKINAWLFPLFAMPLFVATLSTVAANVFGVVFIILYTFSGHWRNWRVILSRGWFWPLMALLTINLVGMLWTEDTDRGLELLIKLKFAIFALTGATLPWTRKQFILLVRMFLAGIALNAILGGLQWLHIVPWRHSDPSEGAVGFTDRIFLSMTLTNAMLWLAYDIKNRIVLPRMWSVVLALMFFLQLLTAGGRAGQLSFVLLLPVVLWMLYPGRWRSWALVVGVLGVVGLGVSPHVQKRIDEARNDLNLYQLGQVETSVGYRLVYWEGALRMLKDHPLLGVGTGDYKIEMARLQKMHLIPNTPANPESPHPHNSYLAYLAGLGLIGLCVFIWFLWSSTIQAWKNRDEAVSWFIFSYMAIFLLGSFTDTLIWGFHNTFALGIILAIPTSLDSAEVRKNKCAYQD